MPSCEAPIPDETLLDYWAGDLTEEEAARIEEHFFLCGGCSTRLEGLASIRTALSTLVRQGRVSGIVTRSILNRMQREGVRVRVYTVSPGETVPCSAYPDDDVLVASLRADLSGVDSVSLSVSEADGSPIDRIDDLPGASLEGEVMLAWPGEVVRRFPALRLRFRLTAGGADGTVLGEYELDHSPTPPIR